MAADLFNPQAKFVGYADVAPEQGVDSAPGGLTYGLTAELAGLALGQRVLVPLGRSNKPVTGYVLKVHPTSKYSDEKIKPVLGLDPANVTLTPDLLELAQWMSNYYCCPLGMVFLTMLPAAVKHKTGLFTRTLVGISARGIADVEFRISDGKETQGGAPERACLGLAEASASVQPKSAIRNPKLTPLQRQLLQTAFELRSTPTPLVEMRELADLAGAKTTGPVKQLIGRGLLVTVDDEAVRADPILDAIDHAPGEGGTLGLLLSDAQTRAMASLTAALDASAFGVHLLHGVTGSGKTEVYLQLIEHLLALAVPPSSLLTPPSSLVPPPSASAPPGAIVLVPEISLTPQTVGRFAQRFSSHGLAVLHSGLTDSQRHEQWRRIAEGRARIVVGARSAIFAPLANLRLVIVDEEHEASYKQDQLPRYHARDLAVKRAQLVGATVVLGSATPSLESYYNATGKPAGNGYQLVELPLRVTGMNLPTVRIVNMKEERRKRYQLTGSAGIHTLSMTLENEVRRNLKAGGQTMLLLNRRGFANYISCPDHGCGWVMACDHCDATMVYHKDKKLPSGGLVKCHHCEAEQLLPSTCPDCGKKVVTFGLGTQRVEEELQEKFPAARIARMDSDIMRTGGDYRRVLDQFRAGELDILAGTQMIAKGLDFPNVRLVGVISADTALNMPDFRAAERTFQLIAQVAGRAGRGSQAGLVIVQTYSPDDATITLAAAHDYAGFAKRELAYRKEVGLPPISRLTRIVVRNTDALKCQAQAKSLGDHLRQYNHQLGDRVHIKGPAQSPIARVAGFHRYQIELIACQAGVMSKLLTALRNAGLLRSDAHTAVDVDAVSLL